MILNMQICDSCLTIFSHFEVLIYLNTLGGSVKGGQVAGTYPDDFTEDAPLNLGRGRMLPTTPW